MAVVVDVAVVLDVAVVVGPVVDRLVVGASTVDVVDGAVVVRSSTVLTITDDSVSVMMGSSSLPHDTLKTTVAATMATQRSIAQRIKAGPGC